VEGPEVYKFKLSAIEGHSIASAQVKYRHFGESHIIARRKLMDNASPVRKRTETLSKPERGVKVGKNKIGPPASNIEKVQGGGRDLRWRWDNTAAETEALEKIRLLGSDVQVRFPVHAHSSLRLAKA
jgi:hypothetical protein